MVCVNIIEDHLRSFGQLVHTHISRNVVPSPNCMLRRDHCSIVYKIRTHGKATMCSSPKYVCCWIEVTDGTEGDHVQQPSSTTPSKRILFCCPLYIYRTVYTCTLVNSTNHTSPVYECPCPSTVEILQTKPLILQMQIPTLKLAN